ncbi:TIR domain-containing adapter molecule 1 [Candoia aspera]|uniref:TIR domain-containing adapter molecule 1 n=1 Tax=Candoia aspera TaxID=51853 RepID=UPI002FD8433F
MPSILDRAWPRMAGNSQADLGFEGIFQVLAQIPEVRLIQYRHKLSCSPQEQRSCHLLHIMILLHLGREDEARVHLNSFRDDVAASHLFRSRWGNAGAGRAPPEHLQEHAEVARTVAGIYSLLADEELCKPLARDEAYGAAIRAFQASNIQGAQLKSLLDEAVDRCGLQFISTVTRPNFGAPVSGRGVLTQPRRSSPVPIDGASLSDNPQPLRSTGSPVSHISLEISKTSSALETDCPYGIDASSPPAGHVEETSSMLLGNGCSVNSGGPSLQNSRGLCSLPDPESTRSPQASFQYPTRCTPTPKTAAAAAGHSPAPVQTPPLQRLDPAASTGGSPTGGAPRPGANSSAPAQITSLGPPRSSSSLELASCNSAEAPSSVGPPADERQFYTFVVLHAAEDEAVAGQVKERLEALGVSNGATFSEDFLVPGHCQLNCFQNALDNSAFTLLLLTRNFKGRLLAYQRNTALMDSLTRFCKSNSVIPFVPKESSLKPEEMPLMLASLVPLLEKSPVFARRAKKTFRPAVVQQKKAAWHVTRQIREMEERHEREQEELQMQQRLSALSLHSQAATPGVDVWRLQGPGGHAPQAFPPSTGVDQGSSQPLMFSVGSSNTVPGPQLIIQNAQMIQIGDYNCMQVERTNAAVGTVDETLGDQG